MSERIVLRTGEALVEGSADYLAPNRRWLSANLTGQWGRRWATLSATR